MVCWSVCLSVDWFVTVVNRAKIAELIEMPFGSWTRVGSRNHILGGDPDHSMRRGNF